MSYLDTYKNKENWSIQKYDDLQIRQHKEKKDFLDPKFMESQIIKNSKKYKIIRKGTFQDWWNTEKSKRNCNQVEAAFDQLHKDGLANTNDIVMISNEKKLKLLDLEKPADGRFSIPLENIPKDLKISYMIRKNGQSWGVHRRIIICYLTSISDAFAAKVNSIFDRFVSGDLKLVAEVAQNNNRNKGVLTDVAYKSTAIDDIGEGAELNGALIGQENPGTFLDLRSVKQIQQALHETFRLALDPLHAQVERLEDQNQKLCDQNQKISGRVEAGIVQKEKFILEELKSRQCIYCMRVHMSNAGSSKHAGNCSESNFAKMKLIVDGNRILKLANLIKKDGIPDEWKSMEIFDSDIENIHIQIISGEDVEDGEDNRETATYRFDSPDDRFKLFQEFEQFFYLDICQVLMPASQEFLKNNKEFFKFFFNQKKRKGKKGGKTTYDFAKELRLR
jgi:hypothetical protein